MKMQIKNISAKKKLSSKVEKSLCPKKLTGL